MAKEPSQAALYAGVTLMVVGALTFAVYLGLALEGESVPVAGGILAMLGVLFCAGYAYANSPARRRAGIDAGSQAKPSAPPRPVSAAPAPIPQMDNRIAMDGERVEAEQATALQEVDLERRAKEELKWAPERIRQAQAERAAALQTVEGLRGRVAELQAKIEKDSRRAEAERVAMLRKANEEHRGVEDRLRQADEERLRLREKLGQVEEEKRRMENERAAALVKVEEELRRALEAQRKSTEQLQRVETEKAAALWRAEEERHRLEVELRQLKDECLRIEEEKQKSIETFRRKLAELAQEAAPADVARESTRAAADVRRVEQATVGSTRQPPSQDAGARTNPSPATPAQGTDGAANLLRDLEAKLTQGQISPELFEMLRRKLQRGGK